MLVRSDVSIHRYDDHRWVLSTPVGNHFVVNDRTASLLRTLQESDSWKEACHRTRDEVEASFDPPEFRALVNEVLGETGLLEEGENKKSTSYLRFRQPILPASLCGILARIFPVPLFRFAMFWALFGIGTLNMVSLVIYVSVPGPAIFVGTHYSFAPVLLVGGMLAHELGHIAACRAKGISHGPIGFGLYFFYPVMYADITNVWRLPQSDRLIANLSGIYGESLYVASLVGVYGLVQDGTYLFVASAVATSSVYQLNPFVRRDGYWVLSDGLCVPNLVAKSKTVVLQWGHKFARIIRGGTSSFHDLTPMNAFLFLYGIVNSVVIFLFLGLVVVQYGWGLVGFPETLFSLVRKAGAGTLTWSAVRLKYLLFIAVYAIVIRYLIAGGRSLLQRTLSLVSNAGEHQ